MVVLRDTCDPPERAEQAGMLLKMGELRDSELVKVMRGWRHCYEVAQKPSFSYLLGGKTLEGQAAREAQYP
jgi:hypothetical protein